MNAFTRAIVIHAPHDLRLEDWAIDAPGENQVQVRIGRGGICGSDLHYYHHGGFGTVRIQQPMVLGHEIAGTVAAVGAGVTSVAPGDLVAVSPSAPCGQCRYCLAGMPNHCLDMRFYGSAMRNPPVHGGFREVLTCRADQAHRLPPGTDLAEAAFAEPLAVCLHAARQAGSLLGQRVLVSGCGPIGALSVLAARHGGAKEVVVTDLMDEPLALALRIGADRAINMAADPHGLAPYAADKGTFDVVFEASGAASAIAAAAAACDDRAARPRRCGDRTAAEPVRRQGAVAARHVPLPRGVRLGGRFHRQKDDRRAAVAERRPADGAGETGVRPGLGPQAVDEGAAGVLSDDALIRDPAWPGVQWIAQRRVRRPPACARAPGRRWRRAASPRHWTGCFGQPARSR